MLSSKYLMETVTLSKLMQSCITVYEIDILPKSNYGIDVSTRHVDI
jgi:hypothetical protein